MEVQGIPRRLLVFEKCGALHCVPLEHAADQYVHDTA